MSLPPVVRLNYVSAFGSLCSHSIYWTEPGDKRVRPGTVCSLGGERKLNRHNTHQSSLPIPGWCMNNEGHLYAPSGGEQKLNHHNIRRTAIPQSEWALLSAHLYIHLDEINTVHISTQETDITLQLAVLEHSQVLQYLSRNTRLVKKYKIGGE